MPRVLVDLLSYSGTKGGMEVYTRELYRHLGAIAPSWEFIGYASREGVRLDQTWFPGEMIDSGISGENRFSWALGELFAVSRQARRLKADLVHSPATLGPRKTMMPTVVTIHDMLYWSHPEFMSTPLYTRPVKWMEKQVARNAAGIITVSPGSASEIRKYLRSSASAIDVVPLAGGHPAGVERTLANSEGPLVLAMGNRRPHKNWDSLPRAIALLPPERRPRVIITGGRGNDPLQPLVTSLGLDQWIELRGWVDDAEVARLYSRATALAIPSLAEGFSLPALEAMSAGVPVLLSDIAVHRYVGGDAARYFAPNDDASLAASIDAVINDDASQRQMSANGLIQAQKFTWERTAVETLEVFQRILDAA